MNGVAAGAAAVLVLVAVGVSEALDIALRAVLNPGDKVLYHEPCYVSYMPSIRLAHAEPIAVSTSAEDACGIDPDQVAAAWEPGCKVLLLNFPTNPTGGVTERAKLEQLARFAVETALLVISDEIYACSVYGRGGDGDNDDDKADDD